MSVTAVGTVDPITRGVIGKILPAIANEMSQVLQRSSYNMMIYEVRDYCCALVAPDGALLCQNVGGVSHFVADLGVVIKDAVDRFGIDGFSPGDGIITNHQRVAGQHLNNVVTYSPVFVDGRLVCFAVVRAHWIDVGGFSTGFGAGSAGAIDPWLEGLQLDQIKLYEGGVVDEKMLRIISDNIRFPESSLGDMRAQFAATRLAEERVAELIGRYGYGTFTTAVAELFDAAEARCRRVVDEFPDGEFFGESFLDGDARDDYEPLEIKVRVVVKGSDLTIDLTNCSLQRKGSTNGRTLAGAYIAYKMLTTPDEPVNEGSFRALQVLIQEGNFMMARYPATMAGWSGAIPMVVDTVFLALSKALKDKIPAAHFGTLSGGMIFIGTNPETGERFVTQDTVGAGWGGRPSADGESASCSVVQGDVRNSPVEAVELKWPILVRRRELRTDSGGAGRYRGGLGMAAEVKNLVPGTWRMGKKSRQNCPPWGLWGGHAGENSGHQLRLSDADPFAEAATVSQGAVPEGASVVLLTAGGGGWGDPYDRPVDEVLGDVVDELVSFAAARNLYGVAIDPQRLIVDEEQTRQLRSQQSTAVTV